MLCTVFMFIPVITPFFNLFSSKESPESIENKNLRFYTEQNFKYENECIQLNKLFIEKGLCSIDKKIVIQPIYSDICTHVTNKKVKVVTKLKCTIFWKSPRNYEYSCWYNVSLVVYDIKKKEIHNFLMNRFITENINEWERLDPFRIR